MTATRHRAFIVDTRTAPRSVILLGVLVAATIVAGITHPVITVAALVTGLLNTAAGGGAIVTFLALSALGVPALTAHATSQCVTPVSFLSAVTGGATRFRPPVPLLAAGGLGALVGVSTLAFTPPGTFRAVAPFVLLPAAVLIAVQGPVKRWVRRTGEGLPAGVVLAAVTGCGIYAGLIGVGTGTLTLVALGLAPRLIAVPLPTLLRVRNVLLLGMATLVAFAIAVTGLVDWGLAVTLVPGAALGGWLGTRLVGRLPVPALQWLIVATALIGGVWMAVS